MILQALVDLYQQLSAQGKIAPAGWAPVKVSYAIYLKEDGQIAQIACMKTQQLKGKKMVLAPQELTLPAPTKRTVGIAPNFLCDNSSYILGVDNKGKPERAISCFEACKALHLSLLSQVDEPAAQALVHFFETWEPSQASTHPALQEMWDDICSGSNLIFRYQTSNLQDIPAIRHVWEQHYNGVSEGPEMMCLVTGQRGPVEAIHPSIKGVQGAQSSGASLVSFNAPAFCSYGKEQNYNAPVGKYATFAYTSALNHLLADREHIQRMGDTTVVFWAKDSQSAYQNMFTIFAFDQPSTYSVADLAAMVKRLCQGTAVEFDGANLDPNMDFYILGLAPNAARLSVRFFLHNSFGTFLKNVQAHKERLEIVRPSFDQFESLPLWHMLQETVNQKSKDKTPAPNMAGQTLRAILMNTPYPATLLYGVNLRIRAEHTVTRGRAAILKAYYLKNPHTDVPKEVLTVSLNPDSTNVPYTLGRLFAVLEQVQASANPGINTTIKDRYFNSASATPSHVFPTLINLAQKHLKKLPDAHRIHLEKLISQLMSILGESYPTSLNLPQQGSFQLGYYHQTQARYTKKEET